MSAPIVPASKIGTPFQSPSWRYQAVYCPERFGFEKYCSKSDHVNAGHLKRLIPNGIQPVDVYAIPLYINQLKNELSDELYEQLLKVWHKHYFRNRDRKITFNVNNRSGLLNWNVKKVGQLNDEFLQKLILHCYNYQGDEYIAEAIKFHKNKNNDMTCRWLNYSIYGGKTDEEMALQWHKPIKFIKALRLIFFDYTGWPKDKLVQYSLIRQLANNREIDDKDYHAFKRIYDLGDLGLRSILGHQMLTEQEQEKVKIYLASAGVDNLMDQRFAITNLKESISFNRSVAEYANIGLHRLEMEQKAAIMRLTAQRMEKELGINDTSNLLEEDTKLLEEMREKMSEDRPGSYPSYADVIDVEAVKVNR